MSPSIIQSSPRPLITIESIEREHNTIVTTCFGDVYLKRLFLPFICVGFLFLLNETHTFVYTPVIIFFIFFIIFWNYPFIVIFTNSKPLYYEDLFVDTSTIETIEIDHKIRIRFEKYFEWSLIITNSILTAGLSDYWLYQSYNKDNFMQIIGITGGILKIFQSINYLTGNIILYMTHYFITTEMEKNKNLEYLGDASTLKLTIIENNQTSNLQFHSNSNLNSNIKINFPPKSQIINSICDDYANIIINDVIDQEIHKIIQELSNIKHYDSAREVYPEIVSDSNIFIELTAFNK